MGGGRDPFEQGWLSRGHPYLAAAFEPGKQGHAAAGVKMRGDFIEKKDRCRPAPFGNQIGVAQHDAEQQRLLLASRAAAGGLRRCAMGDGEVVAVRPVGGAARGGVAAAIGAEDLGEVALAAAFEDQRGTGETVVGTAG